MEQHRRFPRTGRLLFLIRPRVSLSCDLLPPARGRSIAASFPFLYLFSARSSPRSRQVYDRAGWKTPPNFPRARDLVTRRLPSRAVGRFFFFRRLHGREKSPLLEPLPPASGFRRLRSDSGRSDFFFRRRAVDGLISPTHGSVPFHCPFSSGPHLASRAISREPRLPFPARSPCPFSLSFFQLSKAALPFISSTRSRPFSPRPRHTTNLSTTT